MSNKADATDMSQAAKRELKPKLRFPEFRDAPEWEEKNLGDIGTLFLNGGTPSTQKLEFWQGNIPWITGADVVSQKVTEVRRFITEEAVKKSTTNIVEKGNLLIVTRTGVGKVAIAPFDLAISQDLTGIYVKMELSTSEYLYRFLDSNSGKLKSLNQGTSIAGITRETLMRMKVFLPSFNEQQKIADCLSSLDDRITAETQKLDTLKAHKKGLMQQLFPAEGETLPKQRFPEFHDAPEWEVKKLGDFGEFKNGINFSADKKGSGTLTVDVLNMYGSRIEMKLDSFYRVDVDAKDYLLQDGDILFVRSSMKREGIGWSSLFRDFSEPVLFCGFLIRLRLKSFQMTSPEFLLYYLRSDFGRNKIISVSGTAAITNISQDSLKIIPAPLPTLLEQQKIADCLSSLDELITAQTQKLDTLKVHKKGLMQQLFPSVNGEK